MPYSYVPILVPKVQHKMQKKPEENLETRLGLT